MSNPNVDLTEVIEDSLNDAAQTPEPVEDTPDVDVPEDSPVDDTPEVEATDDTEPETQDDDSQVAAPGADAGDEFEKRFGVQAAGVGGRENRIPYSRVKKITEKAVNEIAETALGRKLAPGEKAADVVKAHVAQLPVLQERVTEYEQRLTKVGEFEDIMANQPQKFLQLLERVPAYQSFFQFVREAYKSKRSGQQAEPEAQAEAEVVDGMPEPNETLEDGTKVYNMEGLKALLAWNAKQTEERVTQQVEARYRPIESEWRQRRHIESVIPVIQAQIAEAKTWPMFTENEAEITKTLEADPNISLEGAYRKVVFPKFTADRESMRRQLLQEVRTAPRATAVPGRASTPKPVANTGPRSLEEVIAEQVKQLK